jgi:hypothetical protein
MINRDLLKSIQEKSRERDYLLVQLEVWAQAEAQGIDSSGGGSFGLDAKWFGPKERAQYQCGEFTQRQANDAVRVLMHNYFRYPDGRVVQLNPMIKAVYRD